MKKRNLIFLTLLISVLMVSVVSAGITGYLVRGRTLATDGYKATLQGVQSDGTALVRVTAPSGSTQVVSVREGETAKVGDAQISASSLTRGTLFRRGGGNVEINVVPSSVAGSQIAGQCGCFDPINAFDMINARCKWYQTDALNTNGVIPNEYCNNLGNDYICTDTLNVDYVTSQGSVEGVAPTDCNSMSLAQGLFIRCCDGRPFD